MPLAFRNDAATGPGCCLLSATALFMAMMACVVSSLLILSATLRACGHALRLFLFMTRAMFWKPKMFFGSLSTVYLPLASCGSVVEHVDRVDRAAVERLILEAEGQ